MDQRNNKKYLEYYNTEENLKEWNEIEELVMTYQRCLGTSEQYKAQEAADILLDKFSPLFKSYLTAIKYQQIDWANKEQKKFISQFIGEPELKRALARNYTPSEYCSRIYSRFNFVTVTYGQSSEDDIMNDLYLCFLTLMKRYKQKGKNFCAYVANAYHFEVSRLIKKQTSNPLTVSYKNYKYEDAINNNSFNNSYTDNYYESATGLPDYTWVNGSTCSATFTQLSTIERKILIEYYLEDCNDKQIGQRNALSIGTINCKRRHALDHICTELDTTRDKVKRRRKSGKHI